MRRADFLRLAVAMPLVSVLGWPKEEPSLEAWRIWRHPRSGHVADMMIAESRRFSGDMGFHYLSPDAVGWMGGWLETEDGTVWIRPGRHLDLDCGESEPQGAPIWGLYAQTPRGRRVLLCVCAASRNPKQGAFWVPAVGTLGLIHAHHIRLN